MKRSRAEPDDGALKLGAAPSLTDDGLDALRNGLRQACLAYITLIFVWTSVEFFHPLVGLKGLDFCPMPCFVILLAAFGTALSRPRPLTLRRLRIFETAIFGAMTFFFFTNHLYWMQNGMLGEIAREGKERILMILIGDGIAFP